MMVPSHIRLADALGRWGTGTFSQRLHIVPYDHSSVNSLCDADTVLTIKILHAVLRTERRISLILVLKRDRSTNWTGEQYFEVFHETVNLRPDSHSPLKICAIIFDNLPTQDADSHAFLE
jgi:hypothetical protein